MRCRLLLVVMVALAIIVGVGTAGASSAHTTYAYDVGVNNASPVPSSRSPAGSAESGANRRSRSLVGTSPLPDGSIVAAESESNVARILADQGNEVVLRQATGAGRLSDLLVNGTPYDVYSPTTGSVDRIVSAIASKGSQVAGGGVVIDLSGSPLTAADLGNILARVQGVTSQISDIIVVD